MHHLGNLKKLNSNVNSFSGGISFFLVVLNVSNYAIIPAYFREGKDEFHKYWYKLFSVSSHLFTWIGACEFHRKVHTLLSHSIIFQCKLITCGELTLLLTVIDSGSPSKMD